MSRKTTNSIELLVKKVNSLVKQKKIPENYDSLLEECRKVNVSSYVLNTMIIRAKQNLDRNVSSEELPPIVTVELKQKVKVVEKIKTVEQIIYKYKWGWKTWSLFVMFFTLIFVTVCFIVDNPQIMYQIVTHF